MKKIKSLSKERIIIEAEVNNETACFLIDTGASVGLIDYNQINDFKIDVGRKYNGTIIGAGGKMKNVRHCNTFVNLLGKQIPQFLLADIEDIIESIEVKTGIKILGIISLPQMQFAGINIDSNDMEVIIE